MSKESSILQNSYPTLIHPFCNDELADLAAIPPHTPLCDRPRVDEDGLPKTQGGKTVAPWWMQKMIAKYIRDNISRGEISHGNNSKGEFSHRHLITFLDRIGFYDDKKNVAGWKLPTIAKISFTYFMNTASNVITGGKVKGSNGKDLKDPMVGHIKTDWYALCVKFMAKYISNMSADDEEKKKVYLQYWSPSVFQVVPPLPGAQLEDVSQVMPVYRGVDLAGHVLEEEVDAVKVIKKHFEDGHLPGLKEGTLITHLVMKALHRDTKHVNSLGCKTIKYHDQSQSLLPADRHDALFNIYRALSLVFARQALVSVGRGKYSAKAKMGKKVKVGRKKSGATRIANFQTKSDSHTDAIKDALPSLVDMFGIADATFEEEGIGDFSTGEADGFRTLLKLFHHGALVSELNGVSFSALCSTLFNTAVKRIYRSFEKDGAVPSMCKEYRHNDDSAGTMDADNKKFAQQFRQAVKFRQSEAFQKVKAIQVKKSETWASKKKDKKVNKGVGKKHKEDAFVYDEYDGAEYGSRGMMEEMTAVNDSREMYQYQLMDVQHSSKKRTAKQAMDREDRYNKRRTRYGGAENNMVDEGVDEEVANAAKADAIRRGKFMGV